MKTKNLLKNTMSEPSTIVYVSEDGTSKEFDEGFAHSITLETIHFKLI